jgi:hypothetical protein
MRWCRNAHPSAAAFTCSAPPPSGCTARPTALFKCCCPRMRAQLARRAYSFVVGRLRGERSSLYVGHGRWRAETARQSAVASATAELLPETCRQNENKSADECAAMVEGVESRMTRPQHSAARASNTQSLQGCGGVCIPLRGGEAVPSDGLCSVMRNTSAVLKHDA